MLHCLSQSEITFVSDVLDKKVGGCHILLIYYLYSSNPKSEYKSNLLINIKL